jgi:hypothetical protein
VLAPAQFGSCQSAGYAARGLGRHPQKMKFFPLTSGIGAVYGTLSAFAIAIGILVRKRMRHSRSS